MSIDGLASPSGGATGVSSSSEAVLPPYPSASQQDTTGNKHFTMAKGEATYLIEPLGRTIVAKPGQTLMRAANEAGLRWPTICGGMARCGVCHVRIMSASEPLPPISDVEKRGLQLVPPNFTGPDVRLACQFVGSGELVVFKAGVTPKSE